MGQLSAKETFRRLQDLNFQIGNLLVSLECKKENIVLENEDDPDERFIQYHCHKLIDELDRIDLYLGYLCRPVVAEGILIKKENGAYSISGDDFKFSTGDKIEVLIYDDVNKREDWILTQVKHTIKDLKVHYYLNDFPNIPMDGLRARRRGRFFSEEM